jgi:hypothetical protein
MTPIIRIKTLFGEVILYQGAEFFHCNYLWSIVDFEKDGVLCEMNWSEEGCLFDYADVAEWLLETQESIEYWDLQGI